MNIKQRLIWAFIIIIALPIILLVSTGGAILYYTVNSINDYYGANTTTYQMFMNPTNLVNNSINGIYNELKENIYLEPDQFLSSEYDELLNNKLSKRGSFLVVLKNEEEVFVGNKSRYEKIKEMIPKMTIYSTQEDSGLYIDDKQPLLLKKLDFSFGDGDKGNIYIITNIHTLLPQVKRSCINLLISFFIIICFTACFLTAWLYQGMVRPLNILRNGIYRMKNGDLDFEIKAESDDEISRICDDFEDMRQQVKRLMEERIEYEEQMKMLISNVSHDLKTPLTAIKGYAEGIMDGVADTPEKMERYLKTICTKASDMTYLVDELSFYSKIDCNKIPYNFVEINVEQYFSDCIQDLILDLEVKNIELKYENQVPASERAMIDPEQIKRVINNIIGNSVKYMDKEKGIITVHLTEDNGFIQVCFKDNGKGIPEKDIKKIFERFFRTDQSRNSSKGGSGLGLAIAKKIIQEHGGKIWAESKEGEGTSIIFTLETAGHAKQQEDYKVEENSNRAIKQVKN